MLLDKSRLFKRLSLHKKNNVYIISLISILLLNQIITLKI